MANITVGTSASLLTVGASTPGLVRECIIQNLGTGTLYFSRQKEATTVNGVKIESGGHVILGSMGDPVINVSLISDTAGQDVRWEALS